MLDEFDIAKVCGSGKVAATKRALKAVGASILSTSNPWEVMRFKTKHGAGVVYRNKQGEFTANPAALAALQYVASGMTAPIPPRVKIPRPRPVAQITYRPAVSIFADASFCQQTGSAGWGGWMVGGGLRAQTAGGPLRERCLTSHEAEALALANALHVAKARGYLRHGMLVMLQSDCAPVLSHLRRRLPSTVDAPMASIVDGISCPQAKKPPSPAIARAMEAIAAMAEALDLRFVVRHVRGHQGGDASTGQGRNFVNRGCDRLAKAGMAVARRSVAHQSTPTAPSGAPLLGHQDASA